jgi:hypothetical protein
MRIFSLTNSGTIYAASLGLVCLGVMPRTILVERKTFNSQLTLSQLELVSKADPNQSSATAGALTTPQLNQRTFSADGRYVVFESSSENLVAGLSGNKVTRNIFLHDRVTHNTVLVSHAVGSATAAASGDSFVPCLSGDGRFVVTALNFREDVTANGAINSWDVALAKSKSGTALS